MNQPTAPLPTKQVLSVAAERIESGVLVTVRTIRKGDTQVQVERHAVLSLEHLQQLMVAGAHTLLPAPPKAQVEAGEKEAEGVPEGDTATSAPAPTSDTPETDTKH